MKFSQPMTSTCEQTPRFTSPVSFLGLRLFALVMAMLCIKDAAASTASGNFTCVCDYDPEVDYFPIKLAPSYATNMDIEYRKSYKVLKSRNGAVEREIVAYLCGTPVPQGLPSSTMVVQIPIDSTAITTTTILPYLEYLGKRETLRSASYQPQVMPSCIRKLYDEGELAAGNVYSDLEEIDNKSIAATGEELDVIFAGTFSVNDDAAEAHYGADNKKIALISSDFEPHPLGQLEWVEFVATLFNAEYDAFDLVSRIESRYNCSRDLVAANPPPAPVKVAWTTFCSTFSGPFVCSSIRCPNFQCQLLEDAGAVPLDPLSYNGTEADFIEWLEEADVFIFGGEGFNETNPFGTPALTVTYPSIVNTTVYKNGMIFDQSGQHPTDWFDLHKAEPDVHLLDLIKAIHGDRYLNDTEHELYFLRNVFTDEAVPSFERDPADCTDPNAPLYTGWLDGVCAAAGDVLPGIEPFDLCGDNAASLASPSGLAIVAAVLAAALVGF